MRWLISNLLSLKNYDWLTTIVVFILMAIGLSSIYSVDLSRGEELIYFPTQITALIIGAVVFLIAGALHISFYRSISKSIYFAAVLLLIAVLFFGETVRGTTGWFRVFGFSFQPVEFAKIALVLFLGWWISIYGRRFDRWQFVFTSGCLTFFMVVFVLIQPDLGSSLLLCGIWFLLLFLTGTKKRFIFGLVALAIFASIFSWFFLFKDYQKERLVTFVDPAADPFGSGYNVTQSIIAIGSGQIMGRGLGFGSQSQLHFLPEAQTDFIFAVIAEELGFIGTFVVLLLYLVLLLRMIHIASNSNSDFGSYVVLGVVSLFFLQILFNFGGATGLLPVTGVTLPFLSYGGSSLIINFTLLGIVQSIARSGSV
jgi:rod shape determining protein RodA